ncbi:hypothetical protein HHUSO_G3260 [Huso huso]|uniref:Uncharacterized protein n=1 Tax=Huso huso TaxID=61971 RepID=A0ABR1A975_HUSHU
MGCRCCRMIKSYIFDPVPVEVHGRTSDASRSVYSHQEKPVGTDNYIIGQKFNKLDLNNQKTLAQKQRVENIENDKNQINRTCFPSAEKKCGLGENKEELKVETNGLYILENEQTQKKCATPNNEGVSDTSSSPLNNSLVDNYIAAPSQNSSVVKVCEEQTEAAPKTEDIAISNGKQPSLLNDCQPEVNTPTIQTCESLENDYVHVDVTDSASVDGVDANITILNNAEAVNLSNASISLADMKECVSQQADVDELNDRISPLERGEPDTKSEESSSSIDNFEIFDDLEVAEALAALEAATAGEDEE